MIIPQALQKGDKVAIVAPARSISEDSYPEIIRIIQAQGYIPVRGKSTYLTHGPFAGSDTDRGADLQAMLDDKEIKAIFCLRGGYGTIRIMDQLNFDKLLSNPKWLIGFSDISILHNKLHQLGMASMHGQMPLNFVGRTENKGLEKLFNTLKGKALSYNFTSNSLNKLGSSTGELVGGNVAILCSLIATPYDINTDGKILFIEEVGEYLYRFDRLMHHLKLSGKLTKLKGLIVGGLSEMKDNKPAFGQTIEEIIVDLLQEYDYPVCFDFPAGHIKENYPLILGKTVQMNVSSTNIQISFNQQNDI